MFTYYRNCPINFCASVQPVFNLKLKLSEWHEQWNQMMQYFKNLQKEETAV